MSITKQFKFGTCGQIVMFTGTLFSYDVKFEDGGKINWYTHRENIIECLREFSQRNLETLQYLVSTFGLTIEVTHPVHYSLGESEVTHKVRPHFNVKCNDKTYHIFVTKNHRKIVGVSEILYKDFRF